MGRPSTLPAMFVLLFVAGMALASGTVRVPFALGRFAVGLFAGASIFACGCSSPAGSRLGPGGTPAGTYVVTVTATLGKVPDGFAYGVITRTTQVTLTVR